MVVPFSCKKIAYEEKQLFDTNVIEKECPGCEKYNPLLHNGVYCKIYDWRDDNSLLFKSIFEKGFSK